jgi:riboflavin synthase alpha subunit
LAIHHQAFFRKAGSTAVNGGNLTIAEFGNPWFEVEFIPITMNKSNPGESRTGDLTNVELTLTSSDGRLSA